MKSIDECLEILSPASDAKGVCEWLALKDSTEVGIMDNYYVQETKEIPAEVLRKILDKRFYEDGGKAVNYGVYMPVARLIYTSAKGSEVSIVYSFANACFNLYRNNELVKEGMLFDINELESLLESL